MRVLGSGPRRRGDGGREGRGSLVELEAGTGSLAGKVCGPVEVLVLSKLQAKSLIEAPRAVKILCSQEKQIQSHGATRTRWRCLEMTNCSQCFADLLFHWYPAAGCTPVDAQVAKYPATDVNALRSPQQG